MPFWVDQAKTPVGQKGQLHEYPQRDQPFKLRPQRMDADLALLATRFECIRTYSMTVTPRRELMAAPMKANSAISSKA